MVAVRPATGIVSADDFSRPSVSEQPIARFACLDDAVPAFALGLSYEARVDSCQRLNHVLYATSAAFPLLAHRAAREPALADPHGADERRSWS